MGSDSILNDAVPAFFKDIGRKKRTNRLAKLKQSKLDVRREQWLSQVKNNGTKVSTNGGWGGSPPSFSPVADVRNKPIKSSDSGSKDLDTEGSSHESELESLTSSPLGSSNIPGSTWSSASSRCCSSSVSETEGDDACLDDWETLADALTDKEIRNDLKDESPAGSVKNTCLDDSQNITSDINLLVKDGSLVISGAHENCRAWRADDASRPQSLPNLVKQNNQHVKASRRVTTWAWHSIVSQPASCPICYEDLDITDSSFLPCPCGFRLCLFCHKRILEADARCPGCRKQYDKGDLAFKVGDGFAQIGWPRNGSTRF